MEMFNSLSSQSTSSSKRLYPQLKMLVLLMLYLATTFTIKADSHRGLEYLGYHADTIIDGIAYDVLDGWHGYDMQNEDIYELVNRYGGFWAQCSGTDGLSGPVNIPSYVTFNYWWEDRNTGSRYHTDPITAKVDKINWFRDCIGITSVTIPETVINTEEYAFAGCTNLKSVSWSGLRYIAKGMFEGCTSLESFTILNNVRDIGYSAFAGCTSLKSFTIPETVEQIRTCVFSGCTNLKSVTWPSSLSYISGGVFEGCTSLESFTIPEAVESIGVEAFSGCTSLNSITIPENVKEIGEHAFSGCSSLKSITIPENVKQIGDSAFSNCESLTEMYWNAIDCNMHYINDRYTFASCNNLSHIIIGSEVQRIGLYNHFGMFGCVEPETVTCYAVVPPQIYNYCFSDNTYENAVLNVPAESVEAYRNAIGWGRFFNIVPIGTIPGNELLGDVNNDGLNDVQDIVLLIDFVLNGQAEAFNAENADMNDDTLIDVIDIVALIDEVLNGN